MNTPIEKPESQRGDGSSVVKVGRRRFVRGVGSALPAVVITAHSPSVLGAVQCLAPSAVASIQLFQSRVDRPRLTCDGRSPGFWLQSATPKPNGDPDPNAGAWVSANVSPDKPFSEVFSGGPKDGLYAGKTLKDVLEMGGSSGSDSQQFGAHMIAAYLNLKSGKVPQSILDTSHLSAMWLLAGGSTCGGGYYEPTPGKCWDIEGIKEFLASTWT